MPTESEINVAMLAILPYVNSELSEWARRDEAKKIAIAALKAVEDLAAAYRRQQAYLARVERREK